MFVPARVRSPLPALVKAIEPLSLGLFRSVPLKVGASAKCVLAYLPAVQRDVLLAQAYGADAAARSMAAAELQALRERGYITTVSEVDVGVWGWVGLGAMWCCCCKSAGR